MSRRLAGARKVCENSRVVPSAIGHMLSAIRNKPQTLAWPLADFASAARDEVELGRLTEHLVQAVDDTMQPASVGLWLPGRPARKP